MTIREYFRNMFGPAAKALPEQERLFVRVTTAADRHEYYDHSVYRFFLSGTELRIEADRSAAPLVIFADGGWRDVRIVSKLPSAINPWRADTNLP